MMIVLDPSFTINNQMVVQLLRKPEKELHFEENVVLYYS